MHAFVGTTIRLPLVGGVVVAVVAAMVGIFINQLTTSTPCNCNLDLSARCKQIELYMKGIHKNKGILKSNINVLITLKELSYHKCAIHFSCMYSLMAFSNTNVVSVFGKNKNVQFA